RSSTESSSSENTWSSNRNRASACRARETSTAEIPPVSVVSLHKHQKASSRSSFVFVTRDGHVAGTGVAVTEAVEAVWLSSAQVATFTPDAGSTTDRKSTRLNSSHRTISYAVFC